MTVGKQIIRREIRFVQKIGLAMPAGDLGDAMDMLRRRDLKKAAVFADKLRGKLLMKIAGIYGRAFIRMVTDVIGKTRNKRQEALEIFFRDTHADVVEGRAHQKNVDLVGIEGVDDLISGDNVAVVDDLFGMLKGVIRKKRKNVFIAGEQCIDGKDAAAEAGIECFVRLV